MVFGVGNFKYDIFDSQYPLVSPQIQTNAQLWRHNGRYFEFEDLPMGNENQKCHIFKISNTKNHDNNSIVMPFAASCDDMFTFSEISAAILKNGVAPAQNDVRDQN